MRTVKLLATCDVVLTTAGTAHVQAIDWSKIDGILGRTGAVGGVVHRYGFPRSDLQVKLDGVTIRPTLALGGWAALQPMGNMAMVMGDLVLQQTEVNPVMAKLIEGGVDVTRVHNHLLRAEPLTFYMHIDTVNQDGLALSKTALPATPAGQPPAIDLDTSRSIS